MVPKNCADLNLAASKRKKNSVKVMSHLETLLSGGDTSMVGVWSQSRLKKKRLGRWQQSQKRPSREKLLHESKPVKQMKQNRQIIYPEKNPARWRWVDLVMSPTDQAGRPLWRRRTQRKTKPGQNINNGSHKTKPDQDHEETREFKHFFCLGQGLSLL